MSGCFTVLAGFQTLHHMEALGQAASFDSRLPFLSVICLPFVYLFFSLPPQLLLSFYLQYTTHSLWSNAATHTVAKITRRLTVLTLSLPVSLMVSFFLSTSFCVSIVGFWNKVAAGC